MNTCRICDTKADHPIYYPREMMYGTREEFEYFECTSCGCLQIKNIPTSIEKYYPSNYYSFSKGQTKKFQGLKGKIQTLKYKSRLFGNHPIHFLIRLLNSSNKYDMFGWLKLKYESRVLDVGCGNGMKFLYPLKEAGIFYSRGVDPFIKEDIYYDNGLKIEKRNIFDLSEKFDLITYHHSFEHLENPLEHLIKVSDLLSQDGCCIIRIPTTSSWAWKKYGINWFQLDAPRHFYLHSKKSLEILADKAGLEITKIIYDSTFKQFIESQKYQRNIPLNAPKERGFWNKIKYKYYRSKYNRSASILNALEKGDQAAFFLKIKTDEK